MPGVIKKKSGQLAHLPLNYNTITEEMIFIRDTEKLAIFNLAEIDTVYLGGRLFVPVEKAFYEKATNTPVALYVQHKNGVLPPGSNVGYGMTSESGSVSDLSGVIGSTQLYKLKLPDGYKLVSHNSYWINKDGRYITASLKKLQSIFPAKAAAIKDYAKTNNIKFDKQADMVKLIVFCNEP